MSPPRNATTSGSKRFYSWRNENYWSVTTIINGGVPKEALINWAKKFTAEYAVDNFEKLTALLVPDADGATDRDGAVDWLKGAAYRDRDRKAALGSNVHDAFEAYVLGKPYPTWPLPIRPRMKQVQAFLADHKPVFEATEASVYNRTQRYAGTLDAICTIDGRRLLVDTKTGKGVYPEAALQLAAYRYAEFLGNADGSEVTMPDVDGCAVLHLPDEGTEYELVSVRADEEVFRSFLYVREVFRWCQETSKTVLRATDQLPLEEALAATLARGKTE